MKQLVIILFIVAGSFLKSTAQTTKTPLEYLEFISNQNHDLNKQIWEYTKAVAHDKNPRKIEKIRKSLVVQIQQSRAKVQKKPSYNNDDTYKNQFINFLNVYENVINNDYAKIVDMKEIAEQSYDFMEAYILMQQQVDTKMETALDSINASQKEFATKYDIELVNGEESSISKKMKVSNEVFHHKNDAYLPFFKANFQESELIVSLSSGNVGEIQQKATSLLTFTEEGLDSITKLKPYKNDGALILATEKMLLFYKNEAEVQMPKIIEFYLLNDKVEKMKQAIENKKEKDRTKEEIDEFNEMVKKMNIKITEYNQLNDELNNKRAKLLNEWETTNHNFLSKHIPKN
ncbi:hypothetical protein NBRC110019_14250 [Neptunitalea chrysea]|uniref:Uncharacterized protein n=1 Tax=Neptunitalea chrysea TaxID=1647581 RepID=A0A9W6ETQ7_9FLAO|nr:hypothetical protein [Neptunitalea chrysea]GLB52385.1 hypothetical protein NBRC110019_14250 [Neptunitalea chrysea]